MSDNRTRIAIKHMQNRGSDMLNTMKNREYIKRPSGVDLHRMFANPSNGVFAGNSPLAGYKLDTPHQIAIYFDQYYIFSRPIVLFNAERYFRKLRLV